MRFKVSSRLISTLLLIPLVSGCALMGTEIIRHDRGQYGYEVAKSENAQLLLNVVKLRYLDSTDFLQVSSITAQKTLVGSLSPALTVPYIAHTSSNSLGSSISLTDAPTVSFTPLQGSAFVTSLLTTVSFKSIVYLNNTHFDLKKIMLLSIDRINDYYNQNGVVARLGHSHSPHYDKFMDVVNCMHRLQANQAIAIYYRVNKQGVEQLVVFFNHERDRKTEQKLKHLLHLAANADYMIFSPTYNTKTIKGVVSVKTRSLIGMLSYLANAVDIEDPDSRIAEMPTAIVPIITIHTSLTPVHSAINAFYNNRYFYIDDEDERSKRTFMMLGSFYQLTAGLAGGNSGIVLTLPVGPR